jgi:hypothetical protein
MLFGDASETTAASYESITAAVPVSTATNATCDERAALPARQRAEVVEVQLVVAHGYMSATIVAVRSASAKLNPKSVSEAPPVRAVFERATVDSTGESKLSAVSSVATADATVMLDVPPMRADRQLTAVAAVHDIV